MITKTYTYRGELREAHFRELSVRDTQQLLRDQNVVMGEDGKPQVALDMQREYQRSLLQVALTLVNEDGKRVYQSVERMMDEPTSLLSLLIKLAKEAESEYAATAGN